MHIEKEILKPFRTDTFVSQSGRSLITSNPILNFTQLSWWKAHSLTKTNPMLRPDSSIWLNSKIKIAKKPIHWSQWVEARILHLRDLYKDGRMVDFEHLKEQYEVPKHDFWKYLQLRHCLISAMESKYESTTDIQNLLKSTCFKRGGPSAFYSLIRKANTHNLSGLKTAWEKDIGVSINDDQWLKIISGCFKLSREAQSQFTHYKIINRLSLIHI